MRLVIDGRGLRSGRTGPGRYLEVLLREWAGSGPPLAETIVILADRSGLDLFPETEAIRAEVVGEGWPGPIWERFALGRALRDGDLLFAPTGLIPASWRGPSILLAFDTLMEVQPDSVPAHVRWLFRGRRRRDSLRAARVLTPSQANWRDVAKFHGVPADRLRVVHPAVDASFRPQGPRSAEVLAARSRLGLGSDPFFLCVGRPARHRNIPAILDAFAIHRASHPGHRLVFAGPGHRRAASDGIINAGHVDDATLRGLMADAVALLRPSEYEGFGLPVAEALACGCPAITLRRGGLAEAGGDAAWFLDEADPRDMAGAMHVLATDVAARAARMSRGFSHAARFRPARFADQVRAEIRDVAGLHAPALRGPISGRAAGRRAEARRRAR
ncbi:glycosyltransferase family 4 protein [Tundrisphaera sp. TA3]|uniref:glycosyltransferase family 4 protein n=1 Tax=Tundrisphaera sp. TA3 TaxID=3435775 RepID=UPI003EB7D2B8